ncbi:MAG: ribosomal subunit interface protein [Candidatus Omnitrophica bacterium 4484_213]|nr:MAG: ribosomal subunit interface protein [Candidatus Omnitrophica bacterium 4484_213]
MNLTITGRHFELSDNLKRDIETKVERFKKYFTHIINVHVVISRQKERYLTEIILSAKKLTCTAKEENEDLRFCLNKAIDKVEEQLSHLKDKIKNK